MTQCGCWLLVITGLSISCFSDATGVTLNIPSQIDIGRQNSGYNQMTVSCSHTGGTVYFMVIGKLDQNNNKQAIVTVKPPNFDTINVVDKSLQQRMSQISGSASSGRLQFTLSDLVRTDVGRYYCTMTYSYGTIRTDEDVKNVTARVTGVTLNIPSQIDIEGQNSGNNQMTVSCSHTGGNVYVMEIGKLDQNNNKQAIVTITPPNLDTVTIVDKSLQQRMSQISGSASSGHLQFTLSDLVRTDVGRYYCSMTYNDGTIRTDEDVKNVTARITGVTLNIPSQIDIGGQNSGNNQMTLSCSHTGGNVYVMGIGKLDQNNNKQAIVTITPPNLDTFTIVDKSLQQRMSQINGSASSGHLQFTLSDLLCTDVGRYYCSMTYNDGTIRTDEDVKNVTARTYPGVITMDVTPNNLQYNVGDLIEFDCNGQIGNQFNANNLTGSWQWDWRYTNGSWTSYPNTNNIKYGTPIAAANCQYNGRSRLFHSVTSLDNDRQFRCYTLNNPNYGSNKTVYV